VNFGVFALYGDKALSEALSVSLELVLSMPLESVLVLIVFYSYERK
jgi:hypothetical protein